MGQHKRTAVNKWAAQCSQTLMLEQHRKRRGGGGEWRTGPTEDFKRQPGHSLVTLWKHFCDTLETLLWHFGYSLVTSCIQQGHSQVSCYCIIHAIHTYWWLFWDFQVLTIQLQILVAIEWQVRFTNLPTEGIMNNVYIWWISILVPKIAFKKSNFCGNILHQQFPIFLCQ